MRLIALPDAHENHTRVSRPSFLRAGDVLHPALRKKEGLGMRLEWLIIQLVADNGGLTMDVHSCSFLLSSYLLFTPLCRGKKIEVTNLFQC